MRDDAAIARPSAGRDTRADPAVCRRCARRPASRGAGHVGGACVPDCCRVHPGLEEQRFPIAELERVRLLDYAGERGAFAQEPNTEGFIGAMRRLFPRERAYVDRLFPRHGFHLRLAADQDGSCVFHQGDEQRGGCVLPREARPYHCRLYPLWPRAEGVELLSPARCQALDEGLDPAGTMETLNLSEARARRLMGRLRMAWGLPPEEGMPVDEASFLRYAKVR